MVVFVPGAAYRRSLPYLFVADIRQRDILYQKFSITSSICSSKGPDINYRERGRGLQKEMEEGAKSSFTPPERKGGWVHEKALAMIKGTRTTRFA